MASSYDINIEIAALFRDITDPITFGLNKTELLSKNPTLMFHFQTHGNFEYECNPILSFENKTRLEEFLKQEQHLANIYGELDFTQTEEVNLDEIKSNLSIEDLFLNLNIEIRDDEIRVYFDTNSMVFKYEILS